MRIWLGASAEPVRDRLTVSPHGLQRVPSPRGLGPAPSISPSGRPTRRRLTRSGSLHSTAHHHCPTRGSERTAPAERSGMARRSSVPRVAAGLLGLDAVLVLHGPRAAGSQPLTPIRRAGAARVDEPQRRRGVGPGWQATAPALRAGELPPALGTVVRARTLVGITHEPPSVRT